MTLYPELEIGFRKIESGYTIEARFKNPESDTENRWGDKSPIGFVVDLAELASLAEIGEMEEYGQLLSKNFFTSEIHEIFSRAMESAGTNPLRFRLAMGPGAQDLHGIHWETLRNPNDGTLLTANENILFSRFLSSSSWGSAKTRPRTEVKALVVISSPSDLKKYNLADVDIYGELQRISASLSGLPFDTLITGQKKCTLSNLISQMRSGYDILYLVAHGSMISNRPWIWLEKEDGTVDRVDGQALAKQIQNMSTPPLLIVLASCQSAGTAVNQKINPALQSLGPLLSEAGVPAVIAMQGNILMESVGRMMPVLFAELQKDGLIDRALAVARAQLDISRTNEAWKPALFMRLSQGAIWREDQVKTQLDQVSTRMKGFSLQQAVWSAAILIAVLGVGAGLYIGLKPKQPTIMTGDFRIAVASFYENGDSGQAQLGYDLADSVKLRLEQDIQEINPELVVTIWGPDQVGEIKGDTAETRSEAARALASQIHADMILYGVINVQEETWEVMPEFVVSTDQFSQAEEIVGQYDLGAPFILPGISNSAWKFEFGKQMFARGKALSIMSVGLGYVALKQYDQALEFFKSGLEIEDWEDDQGKKVLYLWTGNAAYKVGEKNLNEKDFNQAQLNFDFAGQMLGQAVRIDENYSRPYIGLANLNYLLAILPLNQTKNIQDIDLAKLDECLSYLDQAEQASEKPSLADVEDKIHFARGQCYWMQTIAGVLPDYGLAVTEFQTVIDDFNNGNDRLQEMAAESYARLGRIEKTNGNMESAHQNYLMAAQLLRELHMTDRSNFYQETADKLAGITPTP